MFKRSEESEWSRFSKAFAGKEKDEKAENESEQTATVAQDSEAAATTDDAASVPPVFTSPSARPTVPDSNLTVSRPAVTAAPHPTYSVDDADSTIGEHTSFDGTYRSDNSMRIRGSVQGEVECAKAIFVEENARVSAKLTAASITVAGEVNGELSCTGRVELRPTGRVTGTINAGTLVVQEGAFLEGTINMRQGAAAEPSLAGS
jgi:cytoskeletal protein CcmA (bactofilin family)